MALSVRQKHRVIYVLLVLALAANIGFWSKARFIQQDWSNVPEPPPLKYAGTMALSDPQLAYRSVGVMLQSFGSSGGRSIALAEYDFDTLKKWFFFADTLDPISDFVPFLAAYYYGATQDTQDLPPLIDYLRHVGQREYGQKWRWLGHGVFLARHRLEDMGLALSLAQDLSRNKNPDMAAWAHQMPAFILKAQGEKEAAYEFLINLLKNESESLHPNEINYMVEVICTELLSDEQAKEHILCKSG